MRVELIHHRRLRRVVLVWSLVFFVGLTIWSPAHAQITPSSSAQPAPPPTEEEDCSKLSLQERLRCEAKKLPGAPGVIVRQGERAAETAGAVASFAEDPFGYIAGKTGDAVKDGLTALQAGIATSSTVPLDQPAFLSGFARAWGLATFVTMMLWLWAVAMRAIRRVPPVEAVGEGIGLLLLSVVATSLIVPATALVVELVDSAVEAMYGDFNADLARLIDLVSGAQGPLRGSPFLAIILGLILLVALLLVWVELIARSAMILLGLMFSPLVFAGAVNRSLWPAIRRWFGVMGAVVASKWVLFATMWLGTKLLAQETPADLGAALRTELTGIVIFGIAVYASVKTAQFLPILGDQAYEAFEQRRTVTPLVAGAAAAVGMASVAGEGGVSMGQSVHRFVGSRGDGIVSAEDAAQPGRKTAYSQIPDWPDPDPVPSTSAHARPATTAKPETAETAPSAPAASSARERSVPPIVGGVPAEERALRVVREQRSLPSPPGAGDGNGRPPAGGDERGGG